MLSVQMNSLALFYRDAVRIPVLSREEEFDLAVRWHEHQDADAAQALVCANLRAVAAIAREYRHFNLPESDLIQEGTLGLMHAVKRFDPYRKFRLMTYASWWVKASIHDFILANWSIVKLGGSKLQRKIFAGLRHAKEAIAAMEGEGLADVAGRYGIDGHEYQSLAAAYLQRDASLDAPAFDEEPMVNHLSADVPDPEQQCSHAEVRQQRSLALQSALQSLPDRERLIVQRRHLSDTPETLKTLAKDYGISIERVRQIEKRALQKIQASMPALLAN